MREVTVRCDGCGRTLVRWTQGLKMTHRVLGVVCGRYVEIRADDMDDVVPLETDAPRYVSQVEEPAVRYAAPRWEVYGRDASLGIYEAATADEAIAACIRDAGYADADAMCAALDDDAVDLDARAVRP